MAGGTDVDPAASTASADGSLARTAQGEGDGLSGEPALATGTRMDRFVVLRVLGAGGAGVVYAAHDPVLDRTVALKVLRSTVASRSTARARFQREAQALGRLNHPNVITVYDVGAVDDRAYIAMEYIDGWTL